MQIIRACLVLVACLTVAATSTVMGQNALPDPVNATYAITNARIIVKPGNVIEKGNVIVRDGKIEAVGARVSIPSDAQIIVGDSLWVYAGFIDGLSHVGIPEPSSQTPPRIDDPGNASYDRIGVRPQLLAHSLLQSDDKSVSTLRELGFTVAHVVPRGALFPGQGSIVVLGGDSPAEMTLLPSASFYGQLVGAPRGQGQSVYPSNILGVMAYWREMFIDAKVAKQQSDAYAADPVSIERPSRHPELDALVPALESKLPVFVRTTSDRNLRRAFQLSTELGFSLVAAGLEDATTVKDFIKEKNIPTIISLALPEDKNKLETDSTLAGMIPIERTTGPDDLEQEKQRLKLRANAALDASRAHAGVLREAGVHFGFSTLDVKTADIRKNLSLLVENGLSEDEALAALTVDAASLLGMSNVLGSIEPGKMANLVLTNGNYFEKDTKVNIVIVDGKPYKSEASATPAPRRGGSGE